VVQGAQGVEEEIQKIKDDSPNDKLSDSAIR
jgi:hypothetical protein